MRWLECFCAALAILLASAAAAILINGEHSKGQRLLSPIRVVSGGVFLCAFTLFLPVYTVLYKGDGEIVAALLSVYNAMRLFVFSGEYAVVREGAAGLAGWLGTGYALLALALFLIAPMLTLGFILSFFKNVSSYRRYFIRWRADAYIFSDLNEKSLALAESIRHNHPKAMLVFTSVFEPVNERSYAERDRAREIGAICFKRDVLSVRFNWHSERGELRFFMISPNEAENIHQALRFLPAYGDRNNTHLYIFAAKIASELLLNGVSKDARNRVKIRRINDARSLVYHTLYHDNGAMFRNALKAEGAGDRRIAAVVVGLGQYGLEMLKALVWYCQMEGYRVQLDAFDVDKNAPARFAALCPELMDEAFNDRDTAGDARYAIRVHGGVDVDARSFTDAISRLRDTTYAFVALGEDERNIKAATELRTLFSRMGIAPRIQTVVYHTGMKNALGGMTNHKDDAYNIEIIGDLATSCSEAVIIESELERKAQACHAAWCNTIADEKTRMEKVNEFHVYDYYYRSSLAQAIHMEACRACAIPGADKDAAQRTTEESERMRQIEQMRWNAYMRSEGYVFSGSIDSASRNDIAKMHNYLTSYEALEQGKRG